MQIACPWCKKNFDVDASLIPAEGRLLQCGFCSHKWFFKNENTSNEDLSTEPFLSINASLKAEIPNNTEILIRQAEEVIKKPVDKKIIQPRTITNENTIISKNPIIIGKIFSYIVVGIISFVALIILLDTFKSPLTEIFPKLDFFLSSLYETLKDVQLFIIDLR